MSSRQTALSVAEIIETALAHSSPGSTPSASTLASLLETLAGPFTQIPALRPDSQEGTLVSFRCMLQDTTYANELFLLPGSAEAEGDAIDYGRLRERGVAWAVGVPGESAWVDEYHTGTSFAAFDTRAPQAFVAHKFPHLQAGRSGSALESIGAFIKTYDLMALSPTTVQTFTGILTFSPSSPPLPIIHVLPRPDASLPSFLPELPRGKHRETHDALLTYLQQALGDPEPWTASYLLGVLCSSTAATGVDQVPLSISLLSSSEPPSLKAALAQLLPVLPTIPLSIALLNKATFSPQSLPTTSSSILSRSSSDGASTEVKSDSQATNSHEQEEDDDAEDTTEDLHAGALQLPANATLLIDERPLGPGGKLGAQGVRNLEELARLVGQGKVGYRFPFSEFAFDWKGGRTIVLGEGRGGLIKTDLALPLLPNPSPSTMAAPPSSSTLAAFRSLLHHAPLTSAPPTLPESTATKIQDAFVSHRKANAGSPERGMKPEELGRLIRLARGVSVARGETEVGESLWEEVWDWERKRRGRLGELEQGLRKEGEGAKEDEGERMIGR